MTTWIRKPAPYDDNLSLEMNRCRDRGAVRCSCGLKHDLEMGDSECASCGQLFNGGGQQLVPQSQWEEPYDED